MWVANAEEERRHAALRFIKYRTFTYMWSLDEGIYPVHQSSIKGLVSIENSLGSSDLRKNVNNHD